MRSRRLTRKLNNRTPAGRIVVSDPFLPVTIKMAKGASLVIKGRLSFESWHGFRQGVYICLKENSVLNVEGDFSLGPGCRIVVEAGGELHIGGRKTESGSGITERGLILVRRRVVIGTDLICAWGTFITDCDWHEVAGQSNTEDTIIGDHVWITPNCSILKGSRIGSGCIVATGSITHKCTYPESTLLGGIPARVLAHSRQWSRDLKEKSRFS